MFDWLLKRKEPPARLKPVEIGCNLTLDLPEQFTVEQEEDNTILVRYPGYAPASLRFTVLSMADEKNPDAADLGIKAVRKMSKKYNVHLLDYPQYSYFTHSGPSPRKDGPGTVHHWTIGFGNAVVVVTACTLNSAQKDLAARALMDSVEPAIKTLRESKH